MLGVSEMFPCRRLLSFFQSGHDVLSLIASFNDLALAEIFFGVVEGIENHGFDLLVGQSVSRFDLYLGFASAALFARGDVEYSICVDEEADFDTRKSCGHGRYV